MSHSTLGSNRALDPVPVLYDSDEDLAQDLASVAWYYRNYRLAIDP